ncbi:MAG: hypothetical protein ACI83O_000172 [Patescibacteria group bacterium]|jgi:HEPN domain-containing protein
MDGDLIIFNGIIVFSMITLLFFSKAKMPFKVRDLTELLDKISLEKDKKIKRHHLVMDHADLSAEIAKRSL